MTVDQVRVLIVDDQEAFRSAARLVVELTDGFSVAGEAATGEDGVAMAADLAPALVLMDMNLPGIDGPEATRRILAANPEVKVIGLSTYEEYEARALAAGAVAFLPKSSFEPSVLHRIWTAVADGDAF
ncbi:MAG: response regulator transcription factor [Acidimicrobiia bacterium]